MLPLLLASLLVLPGAAPAEIPLLAEPHGLVDLGPAAELDWRHFARTGDLRAIGAADDDDLENRDLFPLGDADADGRADVLSVLWYEEEAVFQALSGRDGAVLWERTTEDDDDGFFAILGDVNKDDVLDMTYIEVEYEGGSGPLVAIGGIDVQETLEFTYEVFDGRDLAPLFTWEAEGEFTWKYTGPLVYDQEEFRFRIPSLAAHPDLPGAIEYTIDWHEQEQNQQDVAGVVKIGHDDQRFTLSLRGIDLDGRETWYAEADEEGTSFFITGLWDENDDGVRDFILTGSQYIPADDLTVAGISTAYPGSQAESRVFGRAFDGATGATLLDWASEPSTEYLEGLVLPAGDRNGNGQEYTALLLEYSFSTTLLGQYEYDLSFESLFLSPDGTEERIASGDELVAAAVFADVDDDGDDELELLRLPLRDTPYGPDLDLDHAEYGIAQGDLTYIWSKTDLEDDLPVWLLGAADGPDLTGDGIPEIIWVDYDYDWLAARDGVDGTELWRFQIDEDEPFYLDLGPDLDADGGTDLLWVEFEEEDDAEDEWTRLTGADLTALRGTDAAAFWKTSVYARQPNETLGQYPWVGLYDAGDMDGDGAPDILVNIEGAGDEYAVVCDTDGYCTYEEQEVPEDTETADVAFPLSGLHGDALHFDARSGEDYAANSVGGPSPGPAQMDLEEAHEAPAAGTLPLLAFLALALWTRRRK